MQSPPVHDTPQLLVHALVQMPHEALELATDECECDVWWLARELSEEELGTVVVATMLELSDVRVSEVETAEVVTRVIEVDSEVSVLLVRRVTSLVLAVNTMRRSS